MTCKDCIHDGVCHLQEMSTGLEIEEYIREFGCEDYISNMDLVRVVRCKDCNRYSTEFQMCLRASSIINAKPDDFCSYGERIDT